MLDELSEYFRLSFTLRRKVEGHPLIEATTRDRLQKLCKTARHPRIRNAAYLVLHDSVRDLAGSN